MTRFNKKSTDRIGRATKQLERQPRKLHAPRRQTGGPGGGCQKRFRIYVFGNPQSGFLRINLRITKPGENPDDPPAVHDGNVDLYTGSSLLELASAFETHPGIDEGQVKVLADGINPETSQSCLPEYDVYVDFRNGLRMDQVFVGQYDASFLSGGVHVPFVKIRIE